MVEIGIVEIIGMAGAVGIVASMFIVLYFSRKQAQGFKLHIETKVINDLDEKVRKAIRRVSICFLYLVYLFSCL